MGLLSATQNFIRGSIGGAIGRVLGGFAVQGISVLLSVTLFAPSGTIFWWTQSGVAMALMLHTPDNLWYERAIHLASGLLAYIIIRRDSFPIQLLLSVCACNAAGQLFGYLTMKHYVRSIDETSVGCLRFLTVFAVFPVILASMVASIPGSLGFHLLLDGVPFLNVLINYSFGHIAGTSSILYPALVIPALWKQRKAIVWKEFIGLLVIGVLCSFRYYFLFGFTVIIAIYGIVIWTSVYMDQFYSSVMGLLTTIVVLGFTIGRRGPFSTLNTYRGNDSVVIGTQMAITALTLFSASIVMIFTKMRDLEAAERQSRKDTESKIEDQMVRLFRIGHDLGNNSTLVKGLCENMVDGGDVGSNFKIVDAINTLNGVLISDMVDTVRYDPGKKVSKERVDVADFVDTYIIVAAGMSRLEGKDLVVTSEGFGPDTPVVFTSRERLHQIMCNLVSNAVKYTEGGGIKFTVSHTDEYLSIHVTDTGIGIAEDDVPKVFDAFYRCNKALKVNSGTGVGLSNVTHICDMIGANVSVSSAGEGKGSTFTLSLERGFCTETRSSFSLRVMAIDDSFVIRKLIAKYLRSMGCEVVSICSAEEARSYLSENTDDQFDVIITDGSMGGELGSDFIRNIRRGNVKGAPKDIPCVLCSGENEVIDELDENILFMGKPFSKGDVSVTLDGIYRSIRRSMDSSIV